MSRKNDNNKPPLALLPPHSLLEISKAFEYGAKKYEPWNYLKEGLSSDRLISAAMRHITAWNAGEDLDDESGESHLSHAGANIMMLIEILKHHPHMDSRFKKPKFKWNIIEDRSYTYIVYPQSYIIKEKIKYVDNSHLQKYVYYTKYCIDRELKKGDMIGNIHLDTDCWKEGNYFCFVSSYSEKHKIGDKLLIKSMYHV